MAKSTGNGTIGAMEQSEEMNADKAVDANAGANGNTANELITDAAVQATEVTEVHGQSAAAQTYADFEATESDSDDSGANQQATISQESHQQVDHLPNSVASFDNDESAKSFASKLDIPRKDRQRSVRRKNSFVRVRQLFEHQQHLTANANRQLTRPLSVNLPYTPLTMGPIEGDLQRHRSNDDLVASNNQLFNSSPSLRSPISKQLSASSTRINDLYIIPSKTVYENVKFFESKVKQKLEPKERPVLSISRYPNSTVTEELPTSKSQVTNENNRKIRFSKSADGILGSNKESVEAALDTDKGRDEQSINDLFNNLYDRLKSEQRKSAPQSLLGDTQRLTRVQPGESEHSFGQTMAFQSYSSSTASATGQPIDICIQIDSTTAAASPHSAKSPSTKVKPAHRKIGLTRHRLRRSKSSAQTLSHVNVKISSSQSPVSQYNLCLTQAVLSQFTTRLHRFCKRHSVRPASQSDDSACDETADYFESSSPPHSPTVVPNALHRDSIVNGHEAFTSRRWKDRRKAVYKRNLTLSEYLHRNLVDTASESGKLRFQSDYPWRTFIQSGRNSNRLNGLSADEIRLYESIFEIIITERSYLLQLEKLSTFTENYPQIKAITTTFERTALFGNVVQNLYSVSKKMYTELESEFHLDCFMTNIFTILSKYLNGSFLEPYVDYIKGMEERNRLINEKQELFKTMMMTQAAKLNLMLIIPIQRITRYPLLVKNVLNYVDKLAVKQPNARIPNRSSIEECYTAATLCATKCNTALDDERKLFELITFKQQISGGERINDLVAANRQIVLRSPVKVTRRITIKSNASETALKDIKLKATLILLTDMLILAEFKAKKNQYIVIDFEKLDQIECRHSETSSNLFSHSSSGNNGLTMDLESLDTTSQNHVVPHTPNSPQTPHFSLCVIRFSKNNGTNIYLAAFTSEAEDKFFSEFRRLKHDHLERLNHEPRRRSQTSLRSSNGNNRLSTLSANSFYYSDGDSRSTHSSDIDYSNAT